MIRNLPSRRSGKRLVVVNKLDDELLRFLYGIHSANKQYATL